MTTKIQNKLNIVYVPINELKPAEYNPRVWRNEVKANLKKGIEEDGLVDPLIANSAPNRKNVLIGGHFRLLVLKELKYTEVPVVYINIPDIEKEKRLNLRLNKNLGEFDIEALTNFSEAFLTDAGFSSEELDEIFKVDESPEVFDLEKELRKLQIDKIETQKGDVWQLGRHKIKCGDSTVEADVMDLMDGEKADMVLTDPPYILSYLTGKKRQDKIFFNLLFSIGS